MRLEGVIIGFDEYMNMTLDGAVECDLKTGKRTGEVDQISIESLDSAAYLQSLTPVDLLWNRPLARFRALFE